MQVTPARCRIRMLQPKADFGQDIEMPETPVVEYAVRIIEVDGKAVDMLAAWCCTGNARVDARRTPAGIDCSGNAGPFQQPIDAFHRLCSMRAPLVCQFGRVTAVASHKIAGKCDPAGRIVRHDRKLIVKPRNRCGPVVR